MNKCSHVLSLLTFVALTLSVSDLQTSTLPALASMTETSRSSHDVMVNDDVYMQQASSHETFMSVLQALWGLRYAVLVCKGVQDPLAGANYGRDLIEHDLKRELVDFAQCKDKAYKHYSHRLYQDIKSFVQKTVALLVQTNQVEVAQVLAKSFVDGVGFHFV